MRTPAATKPSIFMWPTTSTPIAIALSNIVEATKVSSNSKITTTSTTSTTKSSTSVIETITPLHHKDVVSDINTIDYLNAQNDNKCKNNYKLFLCFHDQKNTIGI